MLQFWLNLGDYLDKNLSLPADRLSLKQAWLLAALAYSFALLARCFYPAVMLAIPENIYQGLPILNNIDGYLFAGEAKKMLTDHAQASWLKLFSPPHFLSLLIYLLSAPGIWPLEQVIYFIPLIFAPLVCIPIVFIGRALGSTWMGFIAAILASVTWSYYNRSLAGYLDTDTFTTTVPMLLTLALLHLINKPKLTSATIVGVLLYFYYHVYIPGIAIGMAMSVMALAYICWRDFVHKSQQAPLVLLLLAPVFISLVESRIWWAQAAVWLAYAAVVFASADKFTSLRPKWQWLLALGLTALCLALSPLIWKIWGQFFGYLSRGITDTNNTWAYYSVSGTVREAGTIPFEVFANRVAGSVPSYFLAMLAIPVFLLRFRFMVMLLPMAAVGFFALVAGLRFTIYLIPLSMLATAFVALLVAHKINNRKLAIAIPTLATLALLVPNLLHIRDYRPSITTPKAEISALEQLSAIGSSKDYMISWWDYGYDMRFFTGKNTIIDGGAHTDDNFIASTILSGNSQLLAARLMRASAEISAAYYDEHGEFGANTPTQTLFGNRRAGFNPHDLLSEMAKPEYEFDYPKTREVFLYLPTRILEIYRTIRLFSDLNLVTGQTYSDTQYVNLPLRSVNGNKINLYGGMSLDLSTGLLQNNNQAGNRLRAFYQVYFADKQIQQESGLYDSQSRLSAIFYRPTNRIHIVGPQVLRSNLIQMLLLNNINEQLFEVVHRSPEVTVLRLLI